MVHDLRANANRFCASRTLPKLMADFDCPGIAARSVILFCWLSFFPAALCAEETAPGEEYTGATFETVEQTPEAAPARERELGAEEDPLEKAKSETEERLQEAIERGDLSLYGSIRVRYRQVNSESIWSDGGSRVGLTGGWNAKPGLRIFGRAEAGINVLDQIDFLFDRGDRPQGQKFGDTIFLRLLYAGIERPGMVVTAGKNWSTFYRVSSFTDRFQGTGASASGTYNAGTDGGYTGTGRADRALQARFSTDRPGRTARFKPLGLGVQVQYGEPIPRVADKRYGATIGLSSVYEVENGLAVGIAYNHASISDADLVDLRAKGIDGDATALIIGTRWYGDRWYVGTVVSRLQNHETTGKGIYFDGTGWEVYSQYRMFGPWWATAGWNRLKPDGDQTQAGAFKVDYGVLGIRYSFQDFRQMIFANVRFENGSTQDGKMASDVYTIGVRWDLP